jgi:hypothetical protein
MNSFQHKHERGAVSGLLIATIALGVLFLAAGSTAIWAYMNYTEQKTNVDNKVGVAVAEAKKIQADEDDKKFTERDKLPNRQFVGPDDYGRLTFDYPKTWSVYIASDIKNRSSFETYLNPISVPPVTANGQQFALRVKIENADYDQTLTSYQELVKSGKLRSSTVSANGNAGTRLDGSFSDSIRGSAVLFRVRDKTITVRTDADTFKPDFDALIKTINFNT